MEIKKKDKFYVFLFIRFVYFNIEKCVTYTDRYGTDYCNTNILTNGVPFIPQKTTVDASPL